MRLIPVILGPTIAQGARSGGHELQESISMANCWGVCTFSDGHCVFILRRGLTSGQDSFVSSMYTWAAGSLGKIFTILCTK